MTDQTVPVIRVVQHAKMDSYGQGKPTVDYTLGLPGCGKSTWTRAEWDADPTLVVINNDNLGRAMSRHRTKENGALLAAVRATALNLAIDQGRRVIVDNTNLSPRAQREILTAAARDGRVVRCIDFTAVSREECIRRDALRTGNEHVGADVINKMADEFLRTEVPVAEFRMTPRQSPVSPPGRTFLTSDLHFGHANILKYGRDQAFPDLESMHEALIRQWNATVHPWDTVFVLGDVAMGHRNETLPLVQQLNGTKHLIAGNHDNCWEHGKNPAKWREAYLDAGFETIHTEAFFVDGDWNRIIRLHHFPYSGDHTEEDRYPQARPVDDGLPLLHGHVHDLWQSRASEKGTPQVNVGTDVWGYAPVLLGDTLPLLGL